MEPSAQRKRTAVYLRRRDQRGQDEDAHDRIAAPLAQLFGRDPAEQDQDHQPPGPPGGIGVTKTPIEAAQTPQDRKKWNIF